MEPPRDQRLPQGERVPSWVHPTIWRSPHKPEQQVPWPAWEQGDGPLAMPRWKRFVLIHIVPVGMAMVWQLGVVIGFLAIFLSGLTLFRRLRL